MTECKIGSWIALEWYDGPLLAIALVTFPDPTKGVSAHVIARQGRKQPYVNFVKIETWACKIEGEYPRQHATFGLSRENLQAALDLLDGKPVTDYSGKVIVQQTEEPAQ